MARFKYNRSKEKSVVILEVNKLGILDNLNPMQREAASTIDGPILILAGAGSGKTRVLTHRIAYMVGNGVNPWEILAITFTNKAAKEMKTRVHSLVASEDASNIWIGTFHSICVRILKKEIERLGYTRDFVIYDSDDQKKLMGQCMDELNINPKLYIPSSILSEISNAKDNLIGAEKFAKTAIGDSKLEIVSKLYIKYQEKLKACNAVDFDDIIVNTIELFRNFPDVLEHYQNRFKYLLVDEYQDTNSAQYTLTYLLALKNKNICVVGDDDQCIYGWRGANIRNILDFESDYPGTKVIKLEENYRSTKNILFAANHIVRNNSGRKDKSLWTNNTDGEKVSIYTAIDERDEARFVIGTIKKNITEGEDQCKDYSILYRTNAQSRVFEEELMAAMIPYKIYGGLSFYGRKEIKDIVAYLRFIINSNDIISFERIINEPKRGIGAATVKKLVEFAASNRTSVYDSIDYIGIANPNNPGISNAIVTKLRNFKATIADIKHAIDKKVPRQIIEDILDKTGYLAALEKEDTSEAKNRIENLKEFVTAAVEFEDAAEENTLSGFLDNISLVTDLDNMDEKNDNVVSLMTVHTAKGLEFPYVFMTGMEEGIFPTGRVFDSPDKLEEERRLCYVAITRAEKQLFLTNTTHRFIYGRANVNPPSRFLKELPEELLVDLNNAYLKTIEKPSKPKINETNEKSNPNGSYFTGQRVKHGKFGEGIIVTLEDNSGELMLTVAFAKGGIRKLMASIANLEAV
jgi:DNA helicase-2/ATP-dependent DNA helicase PcrA